MRKKAALELSVGTIVIIVIAVTMLILGIVFVRNIMCSGIQLSEELSQGAKNEIKSLFGSNQYGVKCSGEGGQEIKYASGGRRQVVCILKTEDQTNYELSVDEINSLDGASTDIVEGWVLDQDWTGSVKPAEDKEATILLLDVPRDAPTTTVKLTITATNENTGGVSTHYAYFDIVPPGFLKAAIC